MTPRTARIVGWGLAALATAILVPTAVLAASVPDRGAQVSPEVVTIAVAISLSFSLIGALILSRRPDNRLGWLFAAAGIAAATNWLSVAYALRTLASDPTALGGRFAAWAWEIQNPVSIGLMTVFLFLLFPDGRLRTRAERRTTVAVIVAICFAAAGAIVAPTLVEFEDVPSPIALAIPESVAFALLVLGYVLFAGTIVASVVLLVGRLRRAAGRERDQLKILVWSAAVATTLVLPAIFVPWDAPHTVKRVAYLLAGLGFLLIPISVGVAILRHQLLDIDLVIRRTVIVAVLGAFITVVYVGIVVGIGALVGSIGNATLSAVAAAVVAVAFQPVRRGSQRIANRLVYGERASPYEVLHEFSERVAGAYADEDVLPRMARILGEGTGAERAQVWLKVGPQLRPTAVWPNGAVPSRPARLRGAELPEIADVTYAVPVRDGGELLGSLSVTKGASEPMNTTEQKLIQDLALQAGLVLRNVRLVEELRASRTRLVAAQDEERRRIERNIHDGAQQQLVALLVKQRIAEQLADRDPAKVKKLLAELQVETGQAIEDLRDLARGIYPPLLADKGLTAALESQSRKSTLPVILHSNGISRYSPSVEATIYFCVLEALQNASKYSGASGVEIRLEASGSDITFEVSDDGRGFDAEVAPRGSGLQNMSDRLEAGGGSLDVRSAPGEGTRLLGKISLREATRSDPPDSSSRQSATQ